MLLSHRYSTKSICFQFKLNFASYITPFSQLRDTLGGVEYTPTIIVVFFNNDGLEIGKVEGDMKIEGAIRTGQMERLMRR